MEIKDVRNECWKQLSEDDAMVLAEVSVTAPPDAAFHSDAQAGERGRVLAGGLFGPAGGCGAALRRVEDTWGWLRVECSGGIEMRRSLKIIIAAIALAAAAGCTSDNAARKEDASQTAPSATPESAAAVPTGAARAGPKPAALERVGPELVAQTRRFRLYSRLEWNLHDRLTQWSLRAVGQADHAGEDAAGQACVEALPDELKAGWHKAVEAYGARHQSPREGESGPNALEGRLLGLVLRFELLEPGFAVRGEHRAPDWFRPALVRAQPAYEACWWEEDDRRNRAFIMAALPRLRQVEEDMVARLERVHGVTWPGPEPHPIDVVPVVNFGGANTVNRPNHTMLGSTMPGNDDYGTIEIIFHEASHIFCRPWGGGAIDSLVAEATAQEVGLPSGLWHALLFFIAGRSTELAVEQVWHERYRQYGYTQEVYERAWPELIGPIEETWSGWLAGRGTREDAARALVRAVGTPKVDDRVKTPRP